MLRSRKCYFGLRVRLGLRFRREKIRLRIAENESFGNCIFKKLRFENTENYFFNSYAMGCFFENAKF